MGVHSAARFVGATHSAARFVGVHSAARFVGATHSAARFVGAPHSAARFVGVPHSAVRLSLAPIQSTKSLLQFSRLDYSLDFANPRDEWTLPASRDVDVEQISSLAR